MQTSRQCHQTKGRCCRDMTAAIRATIHPETHVLFNLNTISSCLLLRMFDTIWLNSGQVLRTEKHTQYLNFQFQAINITSYRWLTEVVYFHENVSLMVLSLLLFCCSNRVWNKISTKKWNRHQYRSIRWNNRTDTHKVNGIGLFWNDFCHHHQHHHRLRLQLRKLIYLKIEMTTLVVVINIQMGVSHSFSFEAEREDRLSLWAPCSYNWN